jgi:hypothetical protein
MVRPAAFQYQVQAGNAYFIFTKVNYNKLI